MNEDIKIQTFDRGNKPDDKLGVQIVAVYEKNYPHMHRPEDRVEDLVRRDSPDQIRILLEEAVLFVATNVKDEVLGILEWKEREMEDGVYVVLAWMLVNETLRGQGVGSTLHRKFENAAKEAKARHAKPVAQFLNVHDENPAKDRYAHWGYEEFHYEKPERPSTSFMWKMVE